MFRLVNAERARAGVPQLRWWEPARDVNLEHSEYMRKTGIFGHATDIEDRGNEVGCSYVGENIYMRRAKIYRDGRKPEPSDAIAAYMNSRGHRENILHADYRFFVAGTVFNKTTGELYNTQRFMYECQSVSPSVPSTPSVGETGGQSEPDALPTQQPQTRRDYGTRFEDPAQRLAMTVPIMSRHAALVDVDRDGKDDPVVRAGNTFYTVGSSKNARVLASYGRENDEIYAGDWDGDGEESFAVRRGNIFYVKNSIGGGDADYSFSFGRVGDDVVVGDWDGDGRDTFAVRRGNINYFSNSFKGGEADYSSAYGRAGDTLIIGDWDGDGSSSPAVKRGSTVYFKNDFSGGDAAYSWIFRSAHAYVAGDIAGSGRDSIVLVDMKY